LGRGVAQREEQLLIADANISKSSGKFRRRAEYVEMNKAENR